MAVNAIVPGIYSYHGPNKVFFLGQDQKVCKEGSNHTDQPEESTLWVEELVWCSNFDVFTSGSLYRAGECVFCCVAAEGRNEV